VEGGRELIRDALIIRTSDRHTVSKRGENHCEHARWQEMEGRGKKKKVGTIFCFVEKGKKAVKLASELLTGTSLNRHTMERKKKSPPMRTSEAKGKEGKEGEGEGGGDFNSYLTPAMRKKKLRKEGVPGVSGPAARETPVRSEPRKGTRKKRGEKERTSLFAFFSPKK